MVDWDVYPVTRKLIGRREESLVEKFRILIYAEAGVPTQICATIGQSPFRVEYGDGTFHDFTGSIYPSLEYAYSTSGEYIVTFSNYAIPQNPLNNIDSFVVENMNSCLEPLDQLPYFGNRSGGNLFSSSDKPSRLRRVPNGLFIKNTHASGTQMRQKFRHLTSACEFEENAFVGLDKITDIQDMMSLCTGILTIHPNLFKPFVNVESINGLFNRSSIATIPTGLFSDMTNLSDIRNVFSRNINDTVEIGSLEGDFIGYKPLLAVPYALTTIFVNRSEMQGIAPRWWEMYPDDVGISCFTDCVSLSNYSEIPYPWNYNAPQI